MNLLDYYIKGNMREIFDWMNTPLAPVKSAFYKKTSPPHPEWWIASFMLGNNPVGIFKTSQITSSAGTSIYPEEAIIKAIGEAAERYSSLNSHYVDEIKQIEITGEEEIQFARCAWFEPVLDSFKKGGCVGMHLDHSKVNRLTTGEEHYIPSEQVHLGIVRANRRFVQTMPISTGCAFFYDLDTAIWKGLCEYVERDAMMRFWHLKRIPTKIDISSYTDDYDLKVRLRRVKNSGLNLHLFEISEAVNIPTVYAVLESDVFPYYCVGASANSNLLAAAKKAIDEVVSIKMMAIWNGFDSYKDFDDKNFSWVNHLEAHMGLYANWKDCPAFDFFMDKCELASFEDLLSKNWLKTPKNRAELIENAKQVESKGFTVLWKDITTSDILKYGSVVKVVVPEMIPLSQNFSARWLDNLVDTDSPDFDIDSINPYPHPFS